MCPYIEYTNIRQEQFTQARFGPKHITRFLRKGRQMTFIPKGKHYVAGEWLEGAGTFASSPAHGPAHDYPVGTVELVNRACAAAEDAFTAYAATTSRERAGFLRAIADEIEARADAITEIGTQETGLPVARLQGERGRTTGQLRLFAEHI